MAEAIAFIEGCAKASGALSTSHVRDLDRLSEVGKFFTRKSATNLIQELDGAPALTSKSADGTPISVVSRTTHVGPSGRKVVRTGRATEEFLVKHQFVRGVLPTGDSRSVVMLQDPIPLTHGNTVAALVSACQKDWVSLRQFGPQGYRHRTLLLRPVVFLKAWSGIGPVGAT